MTVFEAEGAPRLELPEEPVDIKDGLRQALLSGRKWRDGLSDEMCIVLWLWGSWRPALEPSGLGREEFVDLVIADRRELWLWLMGGPRVVSLHYRSRRQGRTPAARSSLSAMPRVDVPTSKDPLIYVWTELAPPLTSAAGAYSHAVYEKSSLSLREFEATRITMARINQCHICIDWRTARDVPSRAADPNEIPESFYLEVGTNRNWAGLTEREQLSAEFAERYSTDHLGMDDQFWATLHDHFSDDELVDLALCVGSWLALGRFNQVFDIDGACRVPVRSVD